MKRNICLIALSLLCILLCSCEQKQPRPERPTFEKITSSELAYGKVETGTVPGDYIFRSERIGSKTLMLKYHIPTGTAVPVCQDPFCSHEQYAGCPFAASPSQIASIGNVLYYVISEVEGQSSLRSYDGDSMKVEEIYTSNGIVTRLFRYNYYLYFSEKLSTNSQEEQKTTVYRLDTQIGVSEVIDCDDPQAKIYAIEAGRIIWQSSHGYFSTDLNGDDWRTYEQTCIREWGKYRLRWELGKWTYDKIYCKDLATGEEVLIAEDVADFYTYGDKLVYFKFAPTRVRVDEYGVEIRDQYGGNVYVVNLDGTEDRLLCHVEDFVFLCGSSDRNNEFVCGDWIGFISESYYKEHNSDPELLLTDMLVVNVVTGEYKFIKYNPYE